MVTKRPASNSPGEIGRPRSIWVVGRLRFLADAAQRNAVDRDAAKLHRRAGARLRHHLRDPRARLADGIGILQGNARIALHAQRFGLVHRPPGAHHREGVGGEAALDHPGDARVQPLHQRHDGDDRRNRDDIAEHGEQRAQLVGPDRLQRQARGFEELVHRTIRGVWWTEPSGSAKTPDLKVRRSIRSRVHRTSTFAPPPGVSDAAVDEEPVTRT